MADIKDAKILIMATDDQGIIKSRDNLPAVIAEIIRAVDFAQSFRRRAA